MKNTTTLRALRDIALLCAASLTAASCSSSERNPGSTQQVPRLQPSPMWRVSGADAMPLCR